MVLKKDKHIICIIKAVCVCVRCVRFTHNIFYINSEA